MPPLCTVGYGLATFQPAFFFGALYLFFINSVFIAVATYAGVKLMKYKGNVFCRSATRTPRETFGLYHCRAHYDSRCLSDIQRNVRRTRLSTTVRAS